MEKLQIIFYIASGILGIISAGIPSIIAIAKNAKAKAAATSNAEKAAADLAIKNHMIFLIGEAEELYGVVDTALKSMGGSAGSVKKETVMARLQQFALDNAFAFDKDRWSNEIDETVAMTKLVNTKK